MTTAPKDSLNGVVFSKLPPADKFLVKWRALEIDGSEPEQEYVFTGEAAWRFDFAWPQVKVAVEVDGFGFGHQAQQRISQNNAKRNAAVAEGWRVFVFDSRLLGSHANAEDAAHQVMSVLS